MKAPHGLSMFHDAMAMAEFRVYSFISLSVSLSLAKPPSNLTEERLAQCWLVGGRGGTDSFPRYDDSIIPYRAPGRDFYSVHIKKPEGNVRFEAYVADGDSWFRPTETNGDNNGRNGRNGPQTTDNGFE